MAASSTMALVTANVASTHRQSPGGRQWKLRRRAAKQLKRNGRESARFFKIATMNGAGGRLTLVLLAFALCAVHFVKGAPSKSVVQSKNTLLSCFCVCALRAISHLREICQRLSCRNKIWPASLPSQSNNTHTHTHERTCLVSLPGQGHNQYSVYQPTLALQFWMWPVLHLSSMVSREVAGWGVASALGCTILALTLAL